MTAPSKDQLEYLPNRVVVSLTGPDTIMLLERLVTHNTADWSVGEARYGALLTPQGKVIADFLALRTQDGVQLDTAKAHAGDLTKRLKMFRLRAQVEIQLRDDLVVVIHPGADKAGVVDPRHADLPRRSFQPAPGAKPAADYDALRLSLGIPEQGEDFGTAEVFPAEINLDLQGGIDLKKGCFVGQEVVSRMHRRGTIRKRTLIIHGSYMFRADEIHAKTGIGVVSSAFKDIALARIRIDRLARAEAENQPLRIGENTVTVEKPAWLQAEMAALLKP